jgi:hypothetical protein
MLCAGEIEKPERNEEKADLLSSGHHQRFRTRLFELEVVMALAVVVVG